MSFRRTCLTATYLGLFSLGGQSQAQQPLPGAIKEEAAPEQASAHQTAEQSLRDKLAARVDVDLLDTTLADLPAWLRDQQGVKAVLDIKALEEAGIELTSPLKLRVHGVSLRSALRHLFGQHDLTGTIDGELLVITTPEEAEQNDRVAVYNVGDLLGLAEQAPGESRLDYDSLLDLLQTCVAPDSWFPERPFTLREGTIAFPQSDDVHEQIASLFAALRAAKQRAANPASSDWSSIFVEPAGNQTIRAALAKPTDLVFADTSLDQLSKQVNEACSIPVLLDGKALEEAGVSVSTPLSFDGRGLPLAQTLRHSLAQIGLIPVVRDEALVITAFEEAEGVDLGLRVYPVGDLVTPSDDPHFEGGEVIGVIASCRRDTWAESNGPGSASYLSSPQAVVVAHLDEVHEEIDKVLSDLRKARAEQGP